MAYLFKSINDQLQNQSNIFGGQQGAVADQGGSPQGGAIQKTSAQGEITSGGPMGQGNGMQTQGQQSAIAQLGRNQLGAEAFQPIVGNIQNSIKTAGAGLQKEADDYVSGYSSQNYGLDDNVMQSAITNNNPEGWGAASTVASRLANKTAPRVKDFAPKTDVTFSQLENMLSPATMGTELANYQGGDYTKGDRALDSALLSRNPEFRKITEAQRGSANQVRSDKDYLVTEKPVEAQSAADSAYQGATDKITSYLGNAENTLTAAQKAELDQANAPIAEQRAIPRNQEMLSKAVQGVLSGLQSNWGNVDYRNGVDFSSLRPDNDIDSTISFEDAVAHATEMGVDPTTFYHRTNPELLNMEQVISPEEAYQYNQINKLLGHPDAPWTSSAPNARNQLSESFDDSGYRQAIIDAAKDVLRGRITDLARKQTPNRDIILPSDPAGPGSLQVQPNNLAVNPNAWRGNVPVDPAMAGALQYDGSAGDLSSNSVSMQDMARDPRSYQNNTPLPNPFEVRDMFPQINSFFV